VAHDGIDLRNFTLLNGEVVRDTIEDRVGGVYDSDGVGVRSGEATFVGDGTGAGVECGAIISRGNLGAFHIGSIQVLTVVGDGVIRVVRVSGRESGELNSDICGANDGGRRSILHGDHLLHGGREAADILNIPTSRQSVAR
jgi:hypothetical protein